LISLVGAAALSWLINVSVFLILLCLEGRSHQLLVSPSKP